MSQRSARKNSGTRRLFILVGVGFLMACCSVQSAAATDTQIGARVCGSSPESASLQITQPTDDSVVNQSVVTLRGAVASASQIIIELDEEYSTTLALATNQTTFSTDVTLPQGTHTITLRAIEVCGGSEGTDSIVLTYQPAVEPSTGTNTETLVGSTAPGQGVVISDDPASTTESAAQTISRVPVIGPVVGAAADFAKAIGLESTVSSSGSAAAGVARVGVIVTALTTVVMASAWAPAAAQAVPGYRKCLMPLVIVQCCI